jgi:hypothetical protein
VASFHYILFADMGEAASIEHECVEFFQLSKHAEHQKQAPHSYAIT